MRNARGQFVIEAVLLMIVTTGAIIFATRTVQSEKWLSKLTSAQWNKIAGMLESGVWADPTRARAQHPNQIARHRTPYPRK